MSLFYLIYLIFLKRGFYSWEIGYIYSFPFAVEHSFNSPLKDFFLPDKIFLFPTILPKSYKFSFIGFVFLRDLILDIDFARTLNLGYSYEQSLVIKIGLLPKILRIL